ncbi:hypothetical protein H4R33_007152, partial [Dimargaris cristalligena]
MLHFQLGDHIAQLIFQQYEAPLLLETAILDETEYSPSGFGSTDAQAIILAITVPLTLMLQDQLVGPNIKNLCDSMEDQTFC